MTDNDNNSGQIITEPAKKDEQGNSKSQVTFSGNTYDLASIIAVTMGGLALLSCITMYAGIYCFPLIPMVLGIVGLITSRNAVNPKRTQTLSWISLGTGSITFILILMGIVAYFGFLFFLMLTTSELF